MKERELIVEFKKLFIADWIFWKPPAAFTRNGPTRSDIFGVFDFIEVTKWGIVNFYQISTSPHRAERRHKIHRRFLQAGRAIPNAWLFTFNTKSRQWNKELVIWPTEEERKKL